MIIACVNVASKGKAYTLSRDPALGVVRSVLPDSDGLGVSVLCAQGQCGGAWERKCAINLWAVSGGQCHDFESAGR